MSLTKKLKCSVNKMILVPYFILLATVFQPVTYEGKNILFIAFAMTGAFGLLLLTKRFPLKVHLSFYVLLCVLTISFIVNINKAEILSFAYSLFFLFSFLIFITYSKANITKETFSNIASFLLLLYLMFLILGQLYVFFGFFSGSDIAFGIVHGKFGTLYEGGRGFRYYSLSTEPSYAAFIVIVLLFVYTENQSAKSLLTKKNIFMWLVCFYMLISFQSGYGVLLFLMLLFFKLNFRNSVIIIFTLILAIVLAMVTKQPAAERVINFITNFKLSNIIGIASVDNSASFRILPTYYYVNDIDLLDYQFYLGHGAGQSSKFLIPLLFNAPVKEYEGGFLPQFLYDYGIIFGISFLFFLKKEVLTKLISYESVVILFMLTNTNFNTQLFWFVISFFCLHRFYNSRSIVEYKLVNPTISR